MTPGERLRRDLALVASLIPVGARVLDVGCGEGVLLRFLADTRGAEVRGIELDLDRVAGALSHGVPVVQADIDQGLAGFPDHGFDVVVLSQTLQVVRHPRMLLREVLRVGERAIVSFPNFANWRNRLHLSLLGRMPVSRSLPYEWYETPNIHLTTVRDFRELCEREGIRITREIHVGSPLPRPLVSVAPNLLAETSVAVLERV